MAIEGSQSPKFTYCMILLILHSQKDKNIVMENISVVARGYGWGQSVTEKG